ncbi:hypothetical protein [Bradyrhizobium diversitatis]|uniref:Uncharacterized protein n=1 Tax=Bradyrhizobium diversitatis TaxID=2755406 RepID=A0ABS0NVH5_9BRAD|nr:hypothetical protein [Bradyrhizobium diversitatis]MBH5384974.1 hypothetical protein [Bradyrhizobium diversitatis]
MSNLKRSNGSATLDSSGVGFRSKRHEDMLDDMIEDDTELALYARLARIAVTGEPD